MSPETDKEMEAISHLIHERLNCVTEAEAVMASSALHLDEDALSAFVECRLSEDESAPIISHLTECASCRGTTARLIRLESFVLADDDVTIPEQSPSRLRQFLENLAAQVVPSSDEDAVFAYQNPDDHQQSETNARPRRDDSSPESKK